MRPPQYAVFAALLLSLLNSVGGKKASFYDGNENDDVYLSKPEKHHHRDNHFYLNDFEKQIDNFADEEAEQNVCHKTALHKCGQSFLKTFRLISYLTNDVAFKTKCAVRTAFFNCYKKIREKVCKHHSKATVYKYEPDFQRKLTDALWSTRVCILGIKGYPSK